jgi:hypothetical protein
MEVKIFTDVIDALEKVGKAVIALKDMPKKQRTAYRDAVRDTYKLLDSALNLVSNRLSDLVQIAKTDQNKFIAELKALDNEQEWKRISRDVRLCETLRIAHREMDGLTLKVMAFVSGRDWENTRKLVDQVLEREGTLANFISNSLKSLAKQAETASQSSDGFDHALKAVSKTNNKLDKERLRLIKSEIEFLDSL